MIKHLVEVDNSLQLRRLLRKRMLIIRVSALGEASTGKLPLFCLSSLSSSWLKKKSNAFYSDGASCAGRCQLPVSTVG